MSIICTSEDMHPMNCDGPGKCRHCDRLVIVHTTDEGTSHYEHHPADCALCDPAYDGGPPVKDAA
jgi:hypothetical protein